MKALNYIFIALSAWFCNYANATNCFTIESAKENLTRIDIHETYTESATISPFRYNGGITGLCISGMVTKLSDDYLVRVLLKDREGHKYCILESYNMINDSTSFSLKDYCEETVVLDNIEADSIIIILHNAELNINNISVASESGQSTSRKHANLSKKYELKRNQVASIVNRINAYNIAHRIFWGAGATPLALKTYDEKMRYLKLDDNRSTEGYEYYCSGIFVAGSNSRSNINRSSSCVSQFDWCNRHGRNWITGIRNQKHSYFCFAFSSVAAIESMLMLYHNSSDSIILSSDQAARCPYTYNPDDSTDMNHPYYHGGLVTTVLQYAKLNGICDNDAFPFVDSGSVPCLRDVITPNEIVKITDYAVCAYESDDHVKELLIEKGPLVSGFIGHAMQLVGYGVVQVGDVINVNYGYGNLSTNYTVQQSDSFYIGKTYWKFKNSYGYDPDYTVDGFSYIIFEFPELYMSDACYVIHPYCLINTAYNKVTCEDRDGDGYYFWGIDYNKPDFCPDWVPMIPDGDDSNYSKGEMLQNPKGELMNLNPSGVPVLNITGNTIYTTRQSKYSNIIISNGATLTVKNILNLFGRVTVTVQSGGRLIIDGGVVTNVAINLAQGSQLKITNGGKLVMRTNTSFEAPIGAVVEAEHGEIIRSNDF